MDLYSYFQTIEPTAQIIVYIQTGFFVLWFVWLAGISFRQIRIARSINESERVSDEANSDGEPSTAYELRKKYDVVIVQHITAIQEIGRRESQLDIPLLIKNTNDRLNAGSSFLRAFLSIFIIFGLLGTLIGLAGSLSHLSSLSITDRSSSESLAAALDALLRNLGGAFFPSIFGVGLTIASLVLFSVYQYAVSTRLANLIERTTLLKWVPELIETADQRLLNKMEQFEEQMLRNEDQMRLSNEAIGKFEQAAEKFNSDAGELATNVVSASETLKILDTSSRNLNDFSTKFIDGVRHLTTFQEDLKILYEQMQRDSAVFQSTVTALLSENKSFQNKIAEEFRLQSDEGKRLLQALKTYEDSYLATRESIDQKLAAVLEEARNAFGVLGSQNQALITGLAETLGVSLEQTLVAQLKEVSESVSTKLGEMSGEVGQVLTDVSTRITSASDRFENGAGELRRVVNSIEAMEEPLREARSDIERIARGFDKNTRELLLELQSEFEQQNTTTQAQLAKLDGLQGGVAALSEKFFVLISRIESFENSSRALSRVLNDNNGRRRTSSVPPDTTQTRQSFWKRTVEKAQFWKK